METKSHYVINEHERTLLEAAKEFTRVFGHNNGLLVTWKGQEERGKQVLVNLIDAGAASAEGSPSGYARDLPPPAKATD